MNYKKFFRLTGLAVLSPLLASCAQMADLERSFDTAIYNVVGKPLEYIEDSVRGYRVDYVTIPAGAKITCEGEELGRAPLKKWYDLTEKQKTSRLFNISNCAAHWESGATSKIDVEVSLDKYPRNVYLVEERPLECPGMAADEEFGENYLAYRQQQLEQAATAIAGLALAVHQASKSSPPTTSFGTGGPLDIPRFNSVSGSDGITWNWVSSGSNVDFGQEIKRLALPVFVI